MTIGIPICGFIGYLVNNGIRSTNVAYAKHIESLIKKIVKDFNINTVKYRKNFNINSFCDKFSQKKKVRIINRKRK